MIHAFIDGFNFYHVIQERFEQTGDNLKNLDYRKLMARVAGVETDQVAVHFFTAKPTHMGTDKQIRHLIYTNALKSTGALVYEGQFKKENERCKADCRQPFQNWKEKQTDVALAVTLLHQVQLHPKDTFYLLTMDTDQVPVARLIKAHYPEASFFWVIPPKRHASKEAKKILHEKQFIYLHWSDLRACQFDPAVMRPPVKPGSQV